MSVQVLIADDHPVLRVGLRRLLEGTQVSVVAEATTAKEAVALTRRHQPDVVLLDVRMNGQSGLEALERIKQKMPDTPVMMLSVYNNPIYIAQSVALGADDYVLKDLTRRELVAAITAVASGKSPSKHGVMMPVAETMATPGSPDEAAPLTSRETQVTRHLALGLSNKEIALSLDISIETVKEHVQNILRKIKASDRTQAAVWAIRKKLV
jgi:DNA-binding NarL/FixJ family response regulator